MIGLTCLSFLIMVILLLKGIIMDKLCTGCGQTKIFNHFHKDKSRKDGHRDRCKDCVRSHSKKYRAENANKIAESKCADYQNNRERYIKKASKWNKENRERRLEIARKSANNTYHSKLKNDPEYMERNRKQMREYYQKNRQKCWDSTNSRAKTRRKTDPDYQCHWSIRNMLTAIKRKIGTVGEGRSVEKVGYSPLELKEHIESQFQPGMSWENRGEWHIDHIKPICQFISEGVRDPAIINALSNLQPLWAADNMAKGAEYV